MATREENIKKINEELEKLSDEELDKVAGGTLQESSDDSLYLNDLLYGRPGQCDQYGKTKLALMVSAQHDLENAWSSVGVECKLSDFGDNKYSVNGQAISRRRAYEIAWEKVGRNINDMPSNLGN